MCAICRSYLNRGDALVVNDTKVIPARLSGRRAPKPGVDGDGPKIEVTLHKRVGAGSLSRLRKARAQIVGGRCICDWERSTRMWLRATKAAKSNCNSSLQGAALDAAIAREGVVPLPPYIAGKRAADARDIADYQTIFAQYEGSVAAPTAGLHFTPELFSRLEEKGIARESVTLHVGAGTFLPVTAEDTAQHKMHSEWATLSRETAARLNAARARGGRIAAVGTTSLRTLETASRDGRLAEFSGETDIFITPGYRFKAVDILLTNFHLPRSTLFMLVCAFAGVETMKRAYAEAIAKEYRFYSYGDACLLLRGP